MDSPGSELIISTVDNEEDGRPVWIAAWGGMNTVAQALYKVKNTRSEEELSRFINKIRIYDVLGQDDAGAWIAKNFPNLKYIRNVEVYGWGPSDEWTRENVQNRGSLGSHYPNRIWATEGILHHSSMYMQTGLMFLNMSIMEVGEDVSTLKTEKYTRNVIYRKERKE